MMDRPSAKLSICVPTFNRAALLKESLTSILASAKNHEEELEVIISDNASPDDTPAVVAEFQRRYPWIRYHRNVTNIGEANFYRVAEMAQGTHVWIFSDDDKMSPAAIPTVLGYIRSGSPLIFCNYDLWSRDFSFLKEPNRCRLRNNIIFHDPNQFMRRFGEKVTLISATIIARSLFFAVDAAERDRLAEYGHSFMYVVYTAAAACREITYHGNSLVLCRSDNSIMPPDLWDKIFIAGTAQTLDALAAKGYSPQAIHAAKNNVLIDLVFKTILYRKREGIKTQGLDSYAFPFYKRNLPFWVVCVPALFTPKFIPQFLTQIIRMIRPIIFR